MEHAMTVAAPDAGLKLTDEQAATLAALKQIRDQAGEYEERFAKVALVKAQRQSERDSAAAERDALQAEVEKLKKHNEALQHRKTKLADRTQGAQQQQAAVVRNSAALQHSIEALRDKLKPVKAALESLLRHRNAELEEESKYLAMQHKLVDKYGGAHAGAEVEQELAFVDEQIKEAKAEQKEAEAAYAAFVSTKFGTRGPATQLGIAANVLFEDDTLTLADLEERLTAQHKA